MENEKFLPDVITGEMIDIYNPTIPIEKKLDPIKYYLDELDAEIEICKERKKLWNDRNNIVKDSKEKLRNYLLNQLSLTENSLIKTIEHTAYLRNNKNYKLNVQENHLSDDCFDYSIQVNNLSYNDFKLLYDYIESKYNSLNSLKLSYTKKLSMDKVPSVFKDEVITKSIVIK